MKLHPLSCLSALLLFLSSCGGDKTSPYQDFRTSKPLVATDSIDLNSLGILNPTHIYYQDGFLIFTTHLGKKELQFLDQKSGVVSTRHVIGMGPNEMDKYSIVPQLADSPLFHFMDTHRGKMYEVNLEELRQDTTTRHALALELPQPEGARPFRYIESEKAIYGLGIFMGGRIYRYDKQQRTYEETGEYPMNEEISRLDMIQRGALFSGTTMRVTPQDTRLVMAVEGLLDFYEIKSGSVLSLKKRYYHFPKFRLGTGYEPIIAFERNNILGFCGIESDGNYIYMKYFPHSLVETKGQFAPHDLFVYDWDGNPIVHYKLDHGMYGVAVNNGTLYVLCREQDPIVYCYKLDNQ